MNARSGIAWFTLAGRRDAQRIGPPQLVKLRVSLRCLPLCGAVLGAGPFASPVNASNVVEIQRQPPAAAPALKPVTSVAEAFALWPGLRADDQPAELEGVVTGAMPNGAFRLHDGALGLYVAKSADLPRVGAGERVRVTGVLQAGGTSPSITPHAIARLGRAPFPEARPATFSVLASGAVDNQWVEVEGVVRAVHLPEPRDFAVLDLGMDGGNLLALVNYDPRTEYTSLVDAAVRLRGTAAVKANAQKQILEPSLRVPSRAEITVLRPGLPDPFAQPLVPASLILRVRPGVREHPHRVRTGGTVTRQLSATTLFLRDGDTGLKVETSAPATFQPGDRIEVAGFPVVKDGMAVLEQAQARLIGTGAPPEPVVPKRMARLLAGKHNSDLVRVRARLADWVRAGPNVTLVFQADDQLFKGLLMLPESAPLTLPEINSLVDVTGICVISDLEDVWVYRPRAFVVLVAGPADLALVQAPPWWTASRLQRALTMACIVLLATAGWLWALRRQVRRTRTVIEQQARHAAALEERSRIARELHDTLEQGLTGVSLQMKAIETDLERSPAAARVRLQAARQMLRESRAVARNAIRELRSETESTRHERLVDGLRRLAGNWSSSGAPVIDVRVAGTAADLPARVEAHLLGIATEAVTNAIKHGRAAHIRIELERTDNHLSLRIADDGVGFDATGEPRSRPGGFGLLGMRERAHELNGHLRIASAPNRGTQVALDVPLCGRTVGTAPPPLPARASTPVARRTAPPRLV
ncbi:MAG TPA: sensor histidine kinase [Opitutaceae bacterium]